MTALAALAAAVAEAAPHTSEESLAADAKPEPHASVQGRPQGEPSGSAETQTHTGKEKASGGLPVKWSALTPAPVEDKADSEGMHVPVVV